MQTKVPFDQATQKQSRTNQQTAFMALTKSEDGEPELTAQRQQQAYMANSPQVRQLQNMQAMMAGNATQQGNGNGVIQRMGLQIRWANENEAIIAKEIKTSREGHAKANHTSAHVLIRRVIEHTLTGKSYFQCCESLLNLYLNLKSFPGFAPAYETSQSVFDSLWNDFQSSMQEAGNETLRENYTYHLKKLVDIYENARHKLKYTYREGSVGGVGAKGAIDEEADARNMVAAYKEGESVNWVQAAANLFDSRDWKFLYGNTSQENTEKAIAQHCMTLMGEENQIPQSVWKDLAAELVYRIAQQNKKDSIWEDQTVANIMALLKM